MMKLIGRQREPEPNTIEALEHMLEQAKKGEIVGLVYASLHGDGLCSYGKVGLLDSQPNRLAGAISNAQLQYQLNHVLEWVPNER